MAVTPSRCMVGPPGGEPFQDKPIDVLQVRYDAARRWVENSPPNQVGEVIVAIIQLGNMYSRLLSNIGSFTQSEKLMDTPTKQMAGCHAPGRPLTANETRLINKKEALQQNACNSKSARMRKFQDVKGNPGNECQRKGRHGTLSTLPDSVSIGNKTPNPEKRQFGRPLESAHQRMKPRVTKTH